MVLAVLTDPEGVPQREPLSPRGSGRAARRELVTVIVGPRRWRPKRLSNRRLMPAIT
jgi:hypothetical protein